MLWYVIFVGVMCSVSGYIFPVPDPKCDAKDIMCVTEIAKRIFQDCINGVEELGVITLDPIHHDTIEQAIQNLKYSLSDSTVTGFKDIILNQVILTEENNKKIMYLDITLPHYRMTGNYKINGNLDSTPITGQGKYILNADDLHVNSRCDKEYYEKNGEIYLKLTDIKYQTDARGAVHFDVENLTGENKEMSDPVLKSINDNPKAVVNLLEKEITIANMNILFDNYNKILAELPLRQLVTGETLKATI